MEGHAQTRYRAETRRLVARRGRLGATFFLAGVALAGTLEYYYHPARLPYLLLFFGLELAVCFATVRFLRSERLPNREIGLTLGACIALLLCVILYGAFAGTNAAAVALLVIVFQLTTALVFPWGARDQAIVAVAAVGLFGAYVVVGGPEVRAALPIAYDLYGVVAAGTISALGAAFLERQRRTVFAQREQLDGQLTVFRDLMKTFHGFDPQRIVFLTCLSTLQAFGLRRLWIVWRTATGDGVHGYLVRREGERLAWAPLVDAGGIWTWLRGHADGEHAFVTNGDEPGAPAWLRGAGAMPLVCIPFSYERDLLGAICADGGALRTILSEHELDLASVLASGAAIALGNTWLHQQVMAASEEKSVFLARIAHELRNPLQSVLWDLDSTGEENGPSPLQLDRIRQNTLMTLDFAKELQAFSEIETSRITVSPEPISLAQTLDNLRVTALGLLDDRPIAFRTHVGAGAEILMTDPFRLRQILGNLIANAVKFTASGTIELTAERAGAAIVLSVRDSGVGIDAADLTRIFAPFQRGTRRGAKRPRGMGLGLSIASELATLLGGRIEVESEVGRGSTFRLVLPALSAARAGESESVAPETLAGAPVLPVGDASSPDPASTAAVALRQRAASA